MKRNFILCVVFIIFAIQILVGVFVLQFSSPKKLDVIEVNALLHMVQESFERLKDGEKGEMPKSNYPYAVIGEEETIFYLSHSGISDSLQKAIAHRDTILDLVVENKSVGKLILYNEEIDFRFTAGKWIFGLLLLGAVGNIVVFLFYQMYLKRHVFLPFQKLEQFASRVADGNLDIPLTMDSQNIFGVFTESFDLMREQLKKAREQERFMDQSKKELIAKLSHDIKTPVASIKAISEVASIQIQDEKLKQQLFVIGAKADQVNELISNLFHGTLEELQKLEVKPEWQQSKKIGELLKRADYENRAGIYEIPPCFVFFDTLRLQQVFDNLFSNSYKYADTKIEISVYTEGENLCFLFRDFGAGVAEEELPLIFGKFYRGENAKGKAGTGLGLYISRYLMEQMDGFLECSNLEDGFLVLFGLKL